MLSCLSWKPLSGEAECGEGIPDRPVETTASISNAMPRTTSRHSGCIGKSGRRLMARFLAATKSITRTTTRSITNLAIWSALRRANTVAGIARQPIGCCSTWLVSETRRPHGTAPPKAGHGIASTLSRYVARPLLLLANSASVFMKAGIAAASSALRPAGKAVVAPGLPPMSEPAITVVLPSLRRKTTSSFAATRVVAVRDGQRSVPVFNLTVRPGSEFVANGVLVHNCDASSGAFNQLAVSRVFYESHDLEMV